MEMIKNLKNYKSDVNEKARNLKDMWENAGKGNPVWISPFIGLAVKELINPILSSSDEWNGETVDLISDISETTSAGLGHFIGGVLDLTRIASETIVSQETDEEQFVEINVKNFYFMLEIGGIWKVLNDLQNDITSKCISRLRIELKNNSC